MQNLPEVSFGDDEESDPDEQPEPDYENMTMVEWYGSTLPTPEEYEKLMPFLLETELFSEERLAETRALIERIGRGEYTLDEVRWHW